MDNSEKIQQIQALSHAGHTDEALKRLRDVLLNDADNLDLWRLYVEIALHPDDKRFGLQNILDLKPNDAPARASLQRLGAASQPQTALPAYGLARKIQTGQAGGDTPTVAVSKKMLKQLGLNDGDLVGVHAQNGVQMPMVAQERRGNDDHVMLNTSAQRMLAAHPNDAIALIPRETLMLVMDNSASMRFKLRRGISRMRALKNAILRLVDAKTTDDISPDRIGLVSFETLARLIQTPTDDYEAVKRAARTMQTGGGTALYEGLSIALQTLEPMGGVRRIILLTDGVQTTSGDQPILDLAHQAAKQRIVIDTVGIGQPGQHTFNETLLRAIAEITGGQFRYAEDAPALTQSFVALATEKYPLLTDSTS